MIPDVLNGYRLMLKKMSDADVPKLFEIWSNPDVTRYMNIERFTDIQQAQDMVDYLNSLSVQKQAVRYTVVLKETNEVIGSCGFNALDFENAKAEIGYDLDSAHWGNGYAPEAILLLVNHAFEQLHFMRIEAKVAPENTNSIKVLERLGFTFEGTLRKSEKVKDRFVDLNLYSLLATDD